MPAPLALSSPGGRWLVVAAALGSGVAFLDGSVVNVALPVIGREVGGGFLVLQWVLDGYLLSLSALLLLGGALGDRYERRRVFLVGLVMFTVASLGCGLAPSGGVLILARLVQGVGGALLIPGSLALIDASIRQQDRGRAIGTWAGLSGVASALGPFLGGWLVDSASWRWVFFINVPLAAVALVVTLRHVSESRDTTATGRLDIAGAGSVSGPLSNFRSVGRWPRLGRYHGRLLATPDRKHGAVALLDRGTTQAGHRRWTIGGVRHVHLITARSPQPGRGDGRNSAGSAVPAGRWS